MTNKLKDVMFKCPRCGEITQAYARVDEFSHASGTAEIINNDGQLVIDWDSLDADIAFEYVCSQCDEPIAGSLDELEGIVRKYEESRDVPDELITELIKIQTAVGVLCTHASGSGSSELYSSTNKILTDISSIIDEYSNKQESLDKDPELQQRIDTLKYMDKLIRCVNDEENGVFESWLSLGIPDGSTDADYIDMALNIDTYNELCVLWAELMSSMLMEGDWNKSGYTTELYHKTSK